jgi:hypothetical protein
MSQHATHKDTPQAKRETLARRARRADKYRAQ